MERETAKGNIKYLMMEEEINRNWSLCGTPLLLVNGGDKLRDAVIVGPQTQIQKEAMVQSLGRIRCKNVLGIPVYYLRLH